MGPTSALVKSIARMCLRIKGFAEMTIQGHIEGGHVVFDSPVVLPEGTKVIVSVESGYQQPTTDNELPSLYDRLRSIAGKAKGLPADLAINHDHYLHGQPKRQ